MSILLHLVSWAGSAHASRELTTWENPIFRHLPSTLSSNSHGTGLQQHHRRHYLRRLSKSMLPKMLRVRQMIGVYGQSMAQYWLHSNEEEHFEPRHLGHQERSIPLNLSWHFPRLTTKMGLDGSNCSEEVFQRENHPSHHQVEHSAI